MKYILTSLCIVFGLLLVSTGVMAQSAFTEKGIVLAAPQTEGGMPLMQAMKERVSTRSFAKEPVGDQDLSNILWAAWGVNRNDGRRTVPTARNNQDMEVYAVMENGVWRYVAGNHRLERVLSDDLRAKVGNAPLTLMYAGPVKNDAAPMHAGSMYQNVGLYCAGAGLGNVVKTTGADALNGVLPLPKGYKVYVIQSIGKLK